MLVQGFRRGGSFFGAPLWLSDAALAFPPCFLASPVFVALLPHFAFHPRRLKPNPYKKKTQHRKRGGRKPKMRRKLQGVLGAVPFPAAGRGGNKRVGDGRGERYRADLLLQPLPILPEVRHS